jgi:HrpA-like RNA helicase
MSLLTMDALSTVESTVYNPFENAKHNSKLPIHKYRHKIVQAIQESQVTIIIGKTGCGKVRHLLFSQHFDHHLNKFSN